MAEDLLLVGSVPGDTSEEVFRAVGPELGQWLPSIPDGEVGDRTYWINQIAYNVFNGHPDIETIQRPMTKDGVEAESHRVPGAGPESWQFRVKEGVRHVKFGDPGWRLGYARDAVNSYFVFKTLKKEGVLADHLRFQVSIPFTVSAFRAYFHDPEDHPRIGPGIKEALHYEVKTICEHIPHEDLAIQWDCAVENGALEKALVREGGMTPAVQDLATQLFASAHDVCAHIPREVALGFHACYGTSDDWPNVQPPDLTGPVLLCNAAVAAAGRPVDFLHMPTVASSDESYTEPLARLESGGARVYMGLVHSLHQGDGMRRQMEQIKSHLGDFGIAAPCGFGRGPGKMLSQKDTATATEFMDGIIANQLRAVELLHEVRGN